MNDIFASVFYAMPQGLRNMAGSIEGYRLRLLRYGGETQDLIDQALSRDYWTKERWHTWHEDRLAAMLHHAANNVPYYREKWCERRRKGDNSSPERLENWPILTKQEVRVHGRQLIADGVRNPFLHTERTSGTTGTPVRIWIGRSELRQWFALHEARSRGWAGVTREDRWGLIGGRHFLRADKDRPPYWVWNAGLKQLYLSAFHIGPGSVKDYLSAISRYRLQYLMGFSSSLAHLGAAADKSGLDIRLRTCIAFGEPLTGRQRFSVQKGFECVPRETYGMVEKVMGASECERGRLHSWPDAGFLELVLDDNSAAPPGVPGRIIATGLVNFTMPLIRYDVGDMAIVTSHFDCCPCGRRLAVIDRLLGRSDDVITLRDGRQLVQIDGIFAGALPIREGQIIQEDLDRFVIKVVADDGWTEEHSEKVSRSLQSMLGQQIAVEVNLVEAIERTWAGKFRVILSNVEKARG